ncbi:MAG: tRNA (guanosine(46)-N7)-methyltransferase TrmB [Planctomycetota bacterium]|jgi:tRNA (guanine-N7-)-methyltransferase
MARILKNFPQFCLEQEKLSGKLNFVNIFGRSGPVHIEVGSGKGTFLVNQAKANPDVDLIGIEWARKFYRYSVDRIGRWKLTNVRMIRTEAADFIAEFVPDTSIDCFHIYFPDPWPKKRHHKRRFFNEANLMQMLRCLNPGGTIRVATDHAGYFEQIEQVLNGRSDELERVDFSQAAGAEMGEWVGTNFERKYLKENRPIYTAAVRKL